MKFEIIKAIPKGDTTTFMIEDDKGEIQKIGLSNRKVEKGKEAVLKGIKNLLKKQKKEKDKSELKKFEGEQMEV